MKRFFATAVLALFLASSTYGEQSDDDILFPSRKAPRAVIQNLRQFRVGILPFVALSASKITAGENLTQELVKALNQNGISSEVLQTGEEKQIVDTKKHFMEAARAFEKAKSELMAYHFNEAQKVLEQAKSANILASLEDTGFEQRSQIDLLLAESLLRQGKSQEAMDVLGKLVILKPTIELDPLVVPSVVIKEFNALKERIAVRKKGQLEVTSHMGALVWLDGKLLGASPLQLGDVLAGEHVIALQEDGQVIQVKHVDVAENKVSKVEDSANDRSTIGQQLKKNVLEEFHVRQLANLGQLKGFDAVLVGVYTPSVTSLKWNGLLIDTKTGRVARLDSLQSDVELLNLFLDLPKFVASVKSTLQNSQYVAFDNRPIAIGEVPQNGVVQYVETLAEKTPLAEAPISTKADRREILLLPNQKAEVESPSLYSKIFANEKDIKKEQPTLKSKWPSWLWPVIVSGSAILLGAAATAGGIWMSGPTGVDLTVQVPR